MTTAKELAFKAFRENLPKEEGVTDTTYRERFLNWWNDNYISGEHKDSFRPDHNVYVDGKRYIQAE